MRYFTQAALCRAFVRLQEFYESPYPEIRGNYFTLADYTARYVRDHSKPFSYYKDWHGFNVPGHIVRAFAKTFAPDLTFEEKRIVALKPMAYLIGTWREYDFEHEFAHALYHISRAYRQRANTLIRQFEAAHWSASVAFTSWLKREGYTVEVIKDEINAYFATNDLSDFEDHFGETMARVLYNSAKPFRELYAELTTSPSWNRALIAKD